MPLSKDQSKEDVSIASLFTLGEKFITQLSSKEAQDYIVLKNYELATYWIRYNKAKSTSQKNVFNEKINALEIWGKNKKYPFVGKKLNIHLYHTQFVSKGIAPIFISKDSNEQYFVPNLFHCHGNVSNAIASSVIEAMHDFYRPFEESYDQQEIIGMLLGFIEHLKTATEDIPRFLENYTKILVCLQYWWPCYKYKKQGLVLPYVDSLQYIRSNINDYKALCSKRVTLENSHRKQQFFVTKNDGFKEESIETSLFEAMVEYTISFTRLLANQLENIRMLSPTSILIQKCDERLATLLDFSLLNLHEYFWDKSWNQDTMPVHSTGQEKSPCVSPKSSYSNFFNTQNADADSDASSTLSLSSLMEEIDAINAVETTASKLKF